MKTAILLLHWGRPNTLEQTLRTLNGSGNTDFDVIVSNSNRDHDAYIQKQLDTYTTKYKVHYRPDSNDLKGFRRFTIARELDYDRYIFLDDDVKFRQNIVTDMLKQYQPNTYHSWYAWTILSDNYHDRTRVISQGQPIDYAGTGVSMIDRSIVDRPELFDAPPAAYYIEDLWLTHVVKNVYKWPVKYINVPGIKLGGGDQVALYRAVAKMSYKKADFYLDLKNGVYEK